MRVRRLLLLAAVCAAAWRPTVAEPADTGTPRDGMLLQVVTTRQGYDPFMPWQKRRPATRSGYAVIVGPGLVLTTEHMVRNATLVELFAPRAAESIPGTVITADSQVNLALLAVPALAGRDAFRAVPLADATRPDAPFRIMQLDKTRGVQTGTAEELRAEVASLPSTPHASLMLTLLADHAVGGEGAPVLQDGKLAGLVMRYESGERTVDMLPCGVIRRFIDDAQTPPYTGFAAAGFIWRRLVDPWKRAWLGVDGYEGGVLVLACVPDTGADAALQTNDIILKWDGAAVDRLGFYDDPVFGRLLFPHLIKGHRRPGETVTVDVVRDGQPRQITVTLERIRESIMFIPSNTTGAREEYLVEGGLIIREVTGRYLRAHGNNWEDTVDTALVYLYKTRQYLPERPGERVLVLSRVLPHPINVGYQGYQNRIITHVNGVAVDNLGDVFDARRPEGHISRLTLRNEGVDLVLDADGIAEANSELQRLYNIPALQWERPANNAPDGTVE